MKNVQNFKISFYKRLLSYFFGRFMWLIVLRYGKIKRLFFYVLKSVGFDQPRVKNVSSQTLILNPLDSIVELRLFLLRVYEPEVIEYIKMYVSQGMTVVDIGANNGFFTLIMAMLVGGTGRVICFEPNPYTFVKLNENLRINNYKNITPVQKAISDSSGIARISNLSDSALNSCILNFEEESIETETMTLDDYFSNNNIGRCDLIKMDIEGSEHFALKGMMQTIRKNWHIQLIIEVHEQQLIHLGSNKKAFIMSLLKEGFDVYELKPLLKKPQIIKKDDIAQPSGSHFLFKRNRN